MDIDDRFIILTPKTLRGIVKFAKENKGENLVITDESCGGIGDIIRVTTQDNFNSREPIEFVDISDYDSW